MNVQNLNHPIWESEKRNFSVFAIFGTPVPLNPHSCRFFGLVFETQGLNIRYFEQKIEKA